MDEEMLKINILSIAASGGLMLLMGLGMFFFRDAVAKNIRFLLPIPPLAVAAYVFVFNLFKTYNGSLPDDKWTAVREILVSTAVSTVVFLVFTGALIIIIEYARRLS